MSSAAIQEFCRIVRERSSANEQAMTRLSDLPGHQVGILRQELDSMLRVIHLRLSDEITRDQIAQDFVAGRGFLKANGSRITDAEMLREARLHYGWVTRIYDFGCKFIHLSTAHDFESHDPLDDLRASDRSEIRSFFRDFHGADLAEGFSYRDVLPLIPSIFRKLKDNAAYELQCLESGSDDL